MDQAARSPAPELDLRRGRFRCDADEHSNREPFANIVSAPVHDAHYQRLVDDAIKASQDFGDLTRLDAHLENIRIYDANIREAEHRSLRDVQYEQGDCAGKCFDPELSPARIPPDDVDSDASAADVAPEDVPTPTAPVPTPTPSVIHICDTPGCRRRPESDPCGLQQG